MKTDWKPKTKKRIEAVMATRGVGALRDGRGQRWFEVGRGEIMDGRMEKRGSSMAAFGGPKTADGRHA